MTEALLVPLGLLALYIRIAPCSYIWVSVGVTIVGGWAVFDSLILDTWTGSDATLAGMLNIAFGLAMLLVGTSLFTSEVRREHVTYRSLGIFATVMLGVLFWVLQGDLSQGHLDEKIWWYASFLVAFWAFEWWMKRPARLQKLLDKEYPELTKDVADDEADFERFVH